MILVLLVFLNGNDKIDKPTHCMILSWVLLGYRSLLWDRTKTILTKYSSNTGLVIE